MKKQIQKTWKIKVQHKNSGIFARFCLTNLKTVRHIENMYWGLKHGLISTTFVTYISHYEIYVRVTFKTYAETCLSSSCRMSAIVTQFMKIRKDTQILNSPISDLINICSAILKLFHAGEQTDRFSSSSTGTGIQLTGVLHS